MKNLTLTTFNESEISKERSDFHRRFPSSRRGKYKLAVVDASWSCIKNYLLPPTHARAVGEQTFCTKSHSAPLNLYPVRTGRSICQPFFQGDIDFWSKSIAPFPTPAASRNGEEYSSLLLYSRGGMERRIVAIFIPTIFTKFSMIFPLPKLRVCVTTSLEEMEGSRWQISSE